MYECVFFVHLQFVMTQMFFGDVRLLESVGLWEPAVCELREKVGRALRRACGPLRAYAAQYEPYLELLNSDLDALLRSAAQPPPATDAPPLKIHYRFKIQDSRSLFVTYTYRMCSEMEKWRCPAECATEQYK